MPPFLLELAARSGTQPATARGAALPLRTSPAVQLPRGAEAVLPNGRLAVRFVAGVMELARLLGDDPRVR